VLVERIANGYPDTTPEQLEPVNDKAAALFNMAIAFGNILAPILGGWLVDTVGF
jgi:MFS family permease